MPYIAHVGIALSYDYTAYEKDKWYFIKENKGLSFYWRFTKNRIYEVACTLFDDKYMALKAAKFIYCAALYNLLYKGVHIEIAGCEQYEKTLYCPELEGDMKDYPESSFFWNPQYIGGGLGPDVYEVPKSLDDFDEIYNKVPIDNNSCYVQTTDPDLDFDNYDTSPFCYSQEAQPLLNTIVKTDAVSDIGLKMTLYCGLLEHISGKSYKDVSVLSEIEMLIQHVEDSSLVPEEKEQLVSYLRRGKEISARQKCLKLCAKYAKEKYGNHTVKKIINDAYGIRSKYSHGEDCNKSSSGLAPYIKYVILDVIMGYMNDKEVPHA